jgi:hypothetical protein
MLTSKILTKHENRATKTKFRIVANDYNEYSTVNPDIYYTVQIQKTFIGFKYWCTLEHTLLDESNPLKEVTKFNTIEEAIEFISNVKKIKVIDIF